MGVSSDKKLQLIKMIREEQQNNRLKMHGRESFLYGTTGRIETPSIPSTTEAATEGEINSTFSFRLILAVLLLIGFFLWDNSNISIFGVQTEEVKNMIKDESMVQNVFSFMEELPTDLQEELQMNSNQ